MPNGLTVDQSEIMLRKRQKRDSNSILSHLCIKPEAKLHIKILLCQLCALPLVQPINKVDVQRLENEFVTGYRDGDQMLYVSMYNDKAKSLDISNNIFDLWSGL